MASLPQVQLGHLDSVSAWRHPKVTDTKSALEVPNQ